MCEWLVVGRSVHVCCFSVRCVLCVPFCVCFVCARALLSPPRHHHFPTTAPDTAAAVMLAVAALLATLLAPQSLYSSRSSFISLSSA